MKWVIFGLSVSSAWGNGHATLWRGLIRALGRRGHQVAFFERDQPFYAAARDAVQIDGLEVVIHPGWDAVREHARQALSKADVAIVTSYCADSAAATELVLGSTVPARLFYDLDTPVTLQRLADGEAVDYLPPGGLGGFDLVLSYTGGPALQALRDRLGARRALPLYGSVDPAAHHPVAPDPAYRADLSYLGTYAADRQAQLEAMFIAPARQRPGLRFSIGGAQYPADFPWARNIFFMRHLAPAQHPAFFASARLTLNITRRAMAAWGHCPSGRLFEAAACGAPILTDQWPGLEAFYEPGQDVLVTHGAEDTLAALGSSDAALHSMARRARERTLDQHTADHRARDLEAAVASINRAAVQEA